VAGGGRVSFMEGFYGGLGMLEIVFGLLSVLLISEAFPLDEVLEFLVTVS
jgi:hypothetical protein